MVDEWGWGDTRRTLRNIYLDSCDNKQGAIGENSMVYQVETENLIPKDPWHLVLDFHRLRAFASSAFTTMGKNLVVLLRFSPDCELTIHE